MDVLADITDVYLSETNTAVLDLIFVSHPSVITSHSSFFTGCNSIFSNWFVVLVTAENSTPLFSLVCPYPFSTSLPLHGFLLANGLWL